ncbi:hypothetical protein STRCI_007464 [Streptomyces cinnabarinus]|uniref:DUF3800 domain-containing protein n=1 Tax=Streptomyces cinnabarinus TaxID=67287 RepID=A0ABY7KUI4_9ACTN|nr:hypothetical protein [Streptomyces cinnabarinus]WAZ27290.1 hypothetical protein STRCI_007464 [Streptomyces cinnabarinus]
MTSDGGDTGPAATGRLIEVGCDESGSDGENLTGGNTEVFAHASVRLPVPVAAAYVQEIRDWIRSPAEEYKANHLLREKHRAVLEWLLAPAGPIHGTAQVHLIEKAYFVVDRAVDLLLGDPDAALPLYRRGPELFGPERWREFLQAANQLLRVRNEGEPEAPVDTFFRTVGALRPVAAGDEVAETLHRLASARARADAYRAELLAGPPLIPVLNPLLPAIVATAAYWSAGGAAVRLVHDRQNMLTPERIAWIEGRARRAGVRLAGVELVVAREDPRIQLADFLAGIARKIADDELGGRADPELAALLRPYVDPASVWGDAAGRVLLGVPETDGAAPSANINSGV